MTITNDGWRDLGADELIQVGDRSEIHEYEVNDPPNWTEVFASIGMTVKDAREELNWPTRRYQRLISKSDAATIKDAPGPVVPPVPGFTPKKMVYGALPPDPSYLGKTAEEIAAYEEGGPYFPSGVEATRTERDAVVEWLRFLERTDPYLARLPGVALSQRVLNCDHLRMAQTVDQNDVVLPKED